MRKLVLKLNLEMRGEKTERRHAAPSKGISHVRLPDLDVEISSAEMLVVFGRMGRTLSPEFHASQTFCPQFRRGRRTQSHSSANHKKVGVNHIPAVPGRLDRPAEGRERI